MIFIVFALAAAAAEVDDEEPCSALRYARSKGGCVDVRLVDWRWRQADVSDEEEDRPESEDARPAREACARASIPLPADVPRRFLLAVRGDRDEARRRWAETTVWRQRNHPREVQRRPQPHFEAIKRRHIHFLHKSDRRGHLCSYEVIDRPNATFRQLIDEGVTIEDIVEHMHFVACWTYATLLDDVDEVGRRPLDPGGYFLKIIDCRNVGLGDCGGSCLKYFNLVGAVNRHSPERVWRTIVINAPAAVLWRRVVDRVAALLEPQVRAKVTVLRSDYASTLRPRANLQDPASLPRKRSGATTTAKLVLGEEPEELALRKWVVASAPRHGPRGDDADDVEIPAR